MIFTPLAIVISSVWIYLIFGVIVAIWANKTSLDELMETKGKASVINWIIGQSVVVVFWVPLVAVGIIYGISNTLKRVI